MTQGNGCGIGGKWNEVVVAFEVNRESLLLGGMQSVDPKD